MSYKISRECHVHGAEWNKQAAGYFSDKAAARDYVDAILRSVRQSSPSVIADLGGGTGFILEQLIEAGVDGDTKLVVIEESAAQLSMCTHPRIRPLKCSIQSFKRSDIAAGPETVMLISRSVMHYAGRSGQKPWLDNVRMQMKSGERFVHQPGCAEDEEASAALNSLFEQMGVDKWVPHRELMCRMLDRAGFVTLEDFIMPRIEMASGELSARYGICKEDMQKIGTNLGSKYSHRKDFFKTTDEGFVFTFPFRAFVCKAG